MTHAGTTLPAAPPGLLPDNYLTAHAVADASDVALDRLGDTIRLALRTAGALLDSGQLHSALAELEGVADFARELPDFESIALDGYQKAELLRDGYLAAEFFGLCPVHCSDCGAAHAVVQPLKEKRGWAVCECCMSHRAAESEAA